MNQVMRIPFIVYLFLLAIITSGLFLSAEVSHSLSGDEVEYEVLGWNIADGHGYSLSATAPYEPTAFREPGYPFLIAAVYRFFGRRHIYIYITQMLLFFGISVLTFKICQEIFNLQLAKASSLLTAVCPTLANYSVIYYSEIFFTFLLLSSVYFTILAKKTGQKKWFALTAIALALTVLTKTVMLFFFILILAYFFIGSAKRFKKYILNTIIGIFLFLAILTPWFMRNYRLFGIKGLSNRGEMVLLMRVLKLDYPAEKIKAACVYYISENLGARFFPAAVRNPRDFMVDDDHKVYEIEAQLLQSGYSRTEISSAMKTMAISKIKAHPFKYILETPLEFIKMMSFMHIPLLFDSRIIEEFGSVNYGMGLLSILRGIYKLSGYLILLFVVFALYLERNEWRRHFILFAAILYINGIYCLLNGYPRYSVPLIPFYLMYTAVCITAFFKLVAHSKV